MGKSLQHVQGRLVLLLPKSRLPHQHTGLRSTERMQTAEAIEDRQRGRQLITIIKGTDIGIAVGLRVDGTAEVILRSDASIQRRQEPTDGTCLAGLVVVELQRCPFHLMVVLHSILHTLLHGPFSLRCQLFDSPCQEYHQYLLHTLFVLMVQNYSLFLRTPRIMRAPDADCLKIRQSCV